MRVIAGEARGRRLEALPGTEITRPTMDQVKEAMFSIVQFDLPGARVLDLYAGSGAVGLEAASRGAGPVVLVEADRPTARLIESNARELGLQADVRSAKAETFAAAPGRRFDLVFLDPPYDVPTATVESLLAGIAEHGVAERGLVVVERSARDRAPAWPSSFTDTWEKNYGETTLYYGSVDCAQPRRAAVSGTVAPQARQGVADTAL